MSNVQAKDSGPYKCVARSDGKTVSTWVRLVINVDIDIAIDKPFTEELLNKSSPQFVKLANELETEMSRVYQGLPGFKEVQVLEFKSGSIKVRFRIIFEIKVDKPSNQPPPDAKQRVANVVIVKITESNGAIGNIRFNPESLTPQVPPPPPRNLRTTQIKYKQISVTWEPPAHHKYYGMTGYIVRYREFTLEWTSVTTAKSAQDFALHGLKPDTSYVITVLAVNELGKGAPSNAIEPKTLHNNVFLVIWKEYKWVVVPVGIAVLLLILAGVFLCYRRSRRRKALKRERLARCNNDNFALPSQSFATNGLEMAQLASRFREIPREQVLIGKLLGSGQFGKVVSGYLKEDKTHCAIKMLKGPLYVIIELAEHGCLLDYLCKNHMYSVNESTNVSLLTKVDKIRIAFDVAKGLEHLTRHRCVHRDLAARNVLLGANMTAKLADFGLARDVYEKGYYSNLSSKQKLPARWMAIEAIETLRASKESDIWSFGVLLWEIESGGKMPFNGLQVREILKLLKKGTRLSQPPDCSNEL
ncbi:hypothetical protein QZH41_002260 [Actinostola sp. cb2023]|nr:hypothetical protein QZH41_002260 [Actinostola sp. cb2023]